MVGGRLVNRHGTTGDIVHPAPTTVGGVAVRVSRGDGGRRARSTRSAATIVEPTPSKRRSSSSIALCPTDSSPPFATSPQAPSRLPAPTPRRRCLTRRLPATRSPLLNPNPNLSRSPRRKMVRSSARPRPKPRPSHRAHTRRQRTRVRSMLRVATYRRRAARPRPLLRAARCTPPSTRAIRARRALPPVHPARCGRAWPPTHHSRCTAGEARRTRRTSRRGARLRTATAATEGGIGARAIGGTASGRGSRARRGGAGGGRGGGDETVRSSVSIV